jgi:hypothetical protein
MQHLRALRVLALALFVLLGATAIQAQTISIADARSQPLGTSVTVEGAVTVPSGAYAASTFDQGFGLQDDTAGIYVSIADSPGLNLKRLVRVTGVLDDDGFGLLVIRPASLAAIETLTGNELVFPEEIATGDVSEDSEGLLVEVRGVVTRGPTNDLPFGYSVFIDDGSGETQIFIPASTGVNPFNIPYIQVGATIRATGFSGQFQSQYEVLPRFRRDILPGGGH